MGLQLVLYVSSQAATAHMFKYSRYTQTPGSFRGLPVLQVSVLLSGLWHTHKYREQAHKLRVCVRRGVMKETIKAPLATLKALKALTM